MQKANSKEVDKWLSDYTKIIKQLSGLMEEYKNMTRENMTENQISNGFNINFKEVLMEIFNITVDAISNTTNKIDLDNYNRILNLLSELSEGDKKDGGKKV